MERMGLYILYLSIKTYVLCGLYVYIKTVPTAQQKQAQPIIIFFLLFPAHIVIAHTPAGKADLQAGAAQPCL